MRSEASDFDEYLEGLPEDRKDILARLYAAIQRRIPKGFEPVMGYGMPGWAVPHKRYPAGYHCDPSQPLPFMGIASQKNHIAVYHMGLYASEQLQQWITGEWPKHSAKKLDMGKSCIRFRKPGDVPVALIGELASKMTVKEWLELYEGTRRTRK